MSDIDALYSLEKKARKERAEEPIMVGVPPWVFPFLTIGVEKKDLFCFILQLSLTWLASQNRIRSGVDSLWVSPCRPPCAGTKWRLRLGQVRSWGAPRALMPATLAASHRVGASPLILTGGFWWALYCYLAFAVNYGDTMILFHLLIPACCWQFRVPWCSFTCLVPSRLHRVWQVSCLPPQMMDKLIIVTNHKAMI